MLSQNTRRTFYLSKNLTLYSEYKPELEKMIQQRQAKEDQRRRKSLSKLMEDLDVSK
jgi:hypothetical protein